MDKLPFKEKLIKFVQHIDKTNPVELAYLFGSYARGTENSNSDIDVALLFKQKYAEREELLIMGRIIDEGEKFFKQKIDVVSLENASLLLKYEVISEGIVLKDSPQRGSFESLVLREYFGFRRYPEIYNQGMLKRLAAGTYFGGDV